MFDDGLHMHFIGSDILLGHVVVVSCDIRFDGDMPQSLDSNSGTKKNEVVNRLWETELTAYIFNTSFIYKYWLQGAAKECDLLEAS
jgi:hypothetical protein